MKFYQNVWIPSLFAFYVITPHSENISLSFTHVRI